MGERLPGVGSFAPDVVGWSDIVVPPYCPKTDEDKATLQAFEDEIIDRLFVLNADRAKKEQALGRGVKRGKAKRATKASGKTVGATAGSKPKKKRGKKGAPEGQGSLGLG